ncbi:hypothetical protein D6789_03960 [Candidatus Woesearchaeota archaeon]|nr:MAG: hypothetical protein D6789_03960 [Candidatus Woesearchaeota archaeon]
MTVHDDIIAVLDREGVDYTLLEHDHVHTSNDAAKVRGTKLEEAAKALVLEAKNDGERFVFMCVVNGHRRVDLKKVKLLIGTKNASLAHPDTVFERTGCKVGTVPPFPALLGLKGYADEAILEQEHVVFSAASHYKSVRMRSEDWLRVSGCTLAAIGKN